MKQNFSYYYFAFTPTINNPGEKRLTFLLTIYPPKNNRQPAIAYKGRLVGTWNAHYYTYVVQFSFGSTKRSIPRSHHRHPSSPPHPKRKIQDEFHPKKC